MTLNTAQIEQVVREVLARLQARALGVAKSDGCGCGGHSAEACQCADKATSSPPPSAGQLPCAARVVTLSELEGRLDGVRQLVVAPGAIVTPAAADLLRERGVTIVRGTPAPATAAPKMTHYIASTATQVPAASLVADLQRSGTRCEAIAAGELLAAIDALASKLQASGARGLLITAQPRAALCASNRHARVRAALVEQPRDVDACLAEIGANLALINATRVNGAALGRLVQSWAAAPAASCPPPLQARLG